MGGTASIKQYLDESGEPIAPKAKNYLDDNGNPVAPKSTTSPRPLKDLIREASKRNVPLPPHGYVLDPDQKILTAIRTKNQTPTATVRSYDPSVLQQLRDTVANSAIGHSLQSTMPKVASALDLTPSESMTSPTYQQDKGQLLSTQYLAPAVENAFASTTGATRDQLDTTTKERIEGALTGLGGLTSGANMATMAGTAVAAGLTAGIINPASAQVLSRLVSGGFTLDMLHGLYQQHKEYRKAVDSGNLDEAHRIQGEMGVTGIMALLTGKHALTSHPFTPVEETPSRERTNVLHRNAAGEVRQAKGQAPTVWLSPTAWKSLMGAMYPGEDAVATHGVNLQANEHLLSLANDKNLSAASPTFGEVQKLLAEAHKNAGEGSVAIAEKRPSIQANIKVMREELNHTWQRSLSANGKFSDYLKPDSFGLLYRNIPKGMYEHLLEHGYDGYNSPEMVTETAAKLMDGRPERFGVSNDEAIDFLDSYFKEVADQHGTKALESLQHVRGLAEEAKTRAIGEHSRTGGGQGNATVSGVAEGRQGGAAQGVQPQGEVNGTNIQTAQTPIPATETAQGAGIPSETAGQHNPLQASGLETLFNREKVKDDADKFKSALTIPSQEDGVEVPSVNVDVLFPPPKEMESAWRDASMNPLLHEQFKRTGISGFSIEEPYKFDLSEQGNIDPKTGKIAVNAAASNPTHTLAHEVAHDIYRRLTPENRAIIDRYVTGATYIHAEHTGGLEERIADHFADEIANPMSASAPPSIRKIFFESPLEPRPAVTTKAVELAPPEPKRPIYGTWSDVARNGGSLRTGDDIRGLVAKDGDFPLVLKDTYGARHVMPASVAADVLDSPAHNYVNEVFMAKDHIYDKSDFELKRYMEQANKMLAANSYMSSKPGHYNEPDPSLPLSDLYRKELQDKVATSEKILADRKAGVPHRPVPVVPIDTVRTQTSGARMLTDAINTFGNRNRLAREYKNPELPATTTPKTDDALFNREKEKPYKELDRLDPKATMGTPNSAAIITGDGKVKVGDGHYELMEDNGYGSYTSLFAAGGVRIRPAYGGMNIEFGKIDDDVLSRVRKTIASFPGMEFTVEFTPLNGRSSKTISGDADLVLLGLDKWQRVGEAAAKYGSPSYWHQRGNDELFNRDKKYEAKDDNVPTASGYRSIEDTGSLGMVDLTPNDYALISTMTAGGEHSNARNLDSKGAYDLVDKLIKTGMNLSDITEKNRVFKIASHVMTAANDNGVAGVPIFKIDPSRTPAEQRELEMHEAVVHGGQRAVEGNGNALELFPKTVTDHIAKNTLARKAWKTLQDYKYDSQNKPLLALESEAWGLSGKFNRIGALTPDEVDELMWEHLQAQTAHHGDKLNTIDPTGQKYVQALREAGERHESARANRVFYESKQSGLGEGGGQEKEVPSPSGTPEGGGTEGDQGDSGAGSEGVGDGGEGESDSGSLEDRIAPSAAGQESSPEQPKVAVQPVTVQGGTTILSMPVHEPSAKVHTSVPSLTTTQVSVPLKTALDATPVVTRRVLSRKEIMAMAAGLNPQRQVKNVRELMKEASQRNPTKIIP